MLGMTDIGKVVKEIEKIHELTHQTTKLVTAVGKLNGLIEQLIEIEREKVAPKKKKRS